MWIGRAKVFYRCYVARYRNGEKVKPYFANVFFNTARVFFGSVVSAIIIDGKGIQNMYVFKEQMALVFVITFILQYVSMDFFR